mgnify:CR=1 FL=1|jgi:hypothetical protein
MFQKYKKPIIILAAIIALFVLYSTFLKKEEEPVIGAVSSTKGLSAENSELIMLLSELRSIHLDRDFFRNETFLTLFDFTVKLIPEPVSRQNPFAPIGSDGDIPQTQNDDVIDVSAAF